MSYLRWLFSMMLFAKSFSSSLKNWRSTTISLTGSSIASVWSFLSRRSMMRICQEAELLEGLAAKADIAVPLDGVQQLLVEDGNMAHAAVVPKDVVSTDYTAVTRQLGAIGGGEDVHAGQLLCSSCSTQAWCSRNLGRNSWRIGYDLEEADQEKNSPMRFCRGVPDRHQR